ncbi:MAG: DNA polymerase-1 [Pseudohongiellaceae bacterium]|jgi:DNA polymerase-1
MPRTFLIDGSALVYRSFYARGPGPAYAYANSLLSLIEKESPDFALVAMDTPKPTFRHETYKEYKATRQKTPSELIGLLPTFERIAKSLGFPLYALPGWEADDVIGTVAKWAYEAGHEVFMVSADKDFMQVISEQVVMLRPVGGGENEIQGIDAVRAKFHCRPNQVTDVLALMGDSSDNVPGVPGIGEKTALKLIEKYEGLDDIYERLDTIKPPSLQSRLREGKESAYLSKDLVTIRTDAPAELTLEGMAYDGPHVDQARDLFVELDFPSLGKRLGGEAPADELSRDYHVVDTTEQYDAYLTLLNNASSFVIDLETTSLIALQAEIVGLSFSFSPGEAWYLPANLAEPLFGPSGRAKTARERADGDSGPQDMFAPKDDLAPTGNGLPGDPLVPPAGSDLARYLADLRVVFAKSTVAVAGQNLKYDLLVLSRYGLTPANIAFDTMLASYVLTAHQPQHGLDYLSLKHLGVSKIPTSDLIGKGAKQISMWDVPVATCGEYACEDADMTRRLQQLFEKELADTELGHVFREIEMPSLPVLQRMETNGILVDVELLRRLSVEMGERLSEVTKEIHELAGEEFNIASPKQLQAILFEKLTIHEELGIKRLKKTKTGFSTDASVLEQLSAHPLPAKILLHRQLSKLKGTYVDALPELVHPFSGRIHTSYNQAVAATGRLSSTDPNLQNIPIRTAEGRRIREAFIAPEGLLLLAADYSQVELRLMAHLSQDKALLEAFHSGEDIHRRTASLVFGVEPEQVDSELRGQAKAINFGIIYGMGAQRLAQQTGVSNREAAAFIEQYFETFPGVKTWLDNTRELAREQGFVTTLSGRLRKLDGIDVADARTLAGMMNVAVNTPIQGTAADLIKIAMVAVQRRLDKEGLAARMLLQVHDELVFEVPEAEVEALRTLVVEEMTGAMDLDLPLVVDTGTGKNWLQAH